MQLSFKHPLIKGTFILTITGLLSRSIGFFYRICLSRLFGEEGMGIYQLISPVVALSFSLTAAAYQTAISKLVAEYTARSSKHTTFPMWIGLSVSLPLALLCSVVIYVRADWIGTCLLAEARTVPLLRILAFSVPFVAIHSCINGYFYGVKQTGVPALSQLGEQLVRTGFVFLLSDYLIRHSITPTISVAVLGLVIGEGASMAVSVGAMGFRLHRKALIPAARLKYRHTLPALHTKYTSLSGAYKELLHMAIPLTANRLCLNMLQSIETVSIPARLKLYGYDTATALSVYGVLTGMALPLIFFPNALTGSISVLLLPMISEHHALGNAVSIRRATARTIRFCLFIGIGCTLGFVLLGKYIGMALFHSELAGHFITTLGFICPFLYLDTTLSGILQGLGMVGRLFLINVLSLLLRLGFVFCLVPHLGITGYLWGLLAGQLLQCILYLLCLAGFFKNIDSQAS